MKSGALRSRCNLGVNGSEMTARLQASGGVAYESSGGENAPASAAILSIGSVIMAAAPSGSASGSIAALAAAPKSIVSMT